ncbi:MAG: L-seryl-tRNA(Sec) selenium transferase [Deltaproteobacteria bacterium]|nr:L-seryl-tRNA(Sec) selenium transferase [Deltaproteobacteria bacterium]
MDPALSRLLRQLPAVDELLRHPRLLSWVEPLPRSWAAAAVRQVLEAQRQSWRSCPPADLPPQLDDDALFRNLQQALDAAGQPSLRQVINATGVIIHTNLGRSLLAVEALEQMLEVAAHYSTLEYDLLKGERGSRQDHLEGLLRELTGCEAALVVNNNAGAVLLALNTLAQGREVIISRGQLVEIGGSFRLPEIMAVSGAILREVGTTNKTHLRDYENAITSETAMLLKVHPSNFRIVGFTKEVDLPDLVALARRYDLPALEDLGSGCLVDLSRYGLEKEPTVQESLAAGADLVLFSGDKLLGGPQAGFALGSREVVARLRQNPLTRALRPDKLTLAGMEATLRLYLEEPRAVAAIPTLHLLTRPLADVERQARNLARTLKRRWGTKIKVEIRPSEARVGGGALPGASLPSRALALEIPPLAPHELEARLRRAHPPIIARLEHGALLLDLRTIQADEHPALLAALGEVMDL